jgi:hypothetical protein
LNYERLTLFFPILTALGLLAFFLYYLRAAGPRLGTTEWITRLVDKPKFKFTFQLHPMERRDILPVCVITGAFALLSFAGLGDFTAPQTFFRFQDTAAPVVIALPSEARISRIMYYTGLYTGNYKLEYSADGENWTEQAPIPQSPEDKREFAMEQSHANLFKWRYADLAPDGVNARYLRLTADTAPLELGELAIYDDWGELLSGVGADALFDEQELVPPAPTYMNSMYFDEIYHGRAAYETLRNIFPYETVHPPLGKTLISVGISLFGMVPFGWRFIGTLFGVVMLPILYILLKNMFGKTPVAVCGTLLFGFDFMRFVQTRIATIDTYAVFFILIAYLYMYRYIAQPRGAPMRETLRPLAFSGIFFGLGCACKWVVIYAGAGLAALYVVSLVTQYQYYYADGEPGVYSRRVVKTLLVSALFFVVIPAVIYCLSYMPYGLARGMTVKNGMLWNPDYYKLIWDRQVNMFSYHSTLVAEHPYSSWWYEWALNFKPILYYYNASMGNGLRSSFGAFGNPIVWWGGLLAILAMAMRFIVYLLHGPLANPMRALASRLAWTWDGLSLVILIGYFSQLGPWLLVTRIVFVYHYFPSTLFLVLAIAHVFNTLWERGYGRYKQAVYGFTASSGVVFAMFYPVLSGVAVSGTYTRYILKWLPSWIG